MASTFRAAIVDMSLNMVAGEQVLPVAASHSFTEQATRTRGSQFWSYRLHGE
jgi:hypothetical protein